MTKQVKVTLDEDLEKKFDEVKHKEAMTVDAEVFRKLLILHHRDSFPEQYQEAVSAQ